MAPPNTKLEWINAALSKLPIDEAEKGIFLPADCPHDELGARCSATWEILENLSLIQTFKNDGTLTQQDKQAFKAQWLRTANNTVCGGDTPLQFIRQNGPQALALAMRAPWS